MAWSHRPRDIRVRQHLLRQVVKSGIDAGDLPSHQSATLLV